MARRLKKIPEFRSREEEFDFWATHDSSAYQMGKPEQGPGSPLSEDHLPQNPAGQSY